MATAQSLNVLAVPHHEVEALDALAVAGLLHELPRFLDGGLHVLLVAEALLELGPRRGRLVERVDEAADLHGRRVLDDLDERGAIHGEMDGPAHPDVLERLLLLVHPEGLDHALVEDGGRDARHLLGLAPRHRVQEARVVELAREEGRAELGRERRHVIDLELVQVGQALVPVVGVPLLDPDFLVLPRDVAEGPGARDSS